MGASGSAFGIGAECRVDITSSRRSVSMPAILRKGKWYKVYGSMNKEECEDMMRYRDVKDGGGVSVVARYSKSTA